MPYKDPEQAREYKRRHYEKNKESYAAQAADGRARSRSALRDLMAAARDVPCADCGGRWPHYVMQFDHIGSDKEFTVSLAVRRALSVARVQAEIDKCEVVCANCHALRTHRRRAERSAS